MIVVSFKNNMMMRRKALFMPVPAGLSVTAGVQEKMFAQQYCVIINNSR